MTTPSELTRHARYVCRGVDCTGLIFPNQAALYAHLVQSHDVPDLHGARLSYTTIHLETNALPHGYNVLQVSPYSVVGTTVCLTWELADGTTVDSLKRVSKHLKRKRR
jgi:hypothetical protein